MVVARTGTALAPLLTDTAAAGHARQTRRGAVAEAVRRTDHMKPQGISHVGRVRGARARHVH
eukprot:8071564-Pyramimonas_sp.AAC.1